MSPLRRLAVAGVSLTALACLSCGFLKSLAGVNTVDLSKADVKSMSVDIRKQLKTICPREQVQMAVFADVVLEGDKEPKSFETWVGRDNVNKNDRLDFEDFAFFSKQGTFEESGWFNPAHDLLMTADEEFEITTAYKRRPDKFTFKMKYKPDYGCITSGGRTGESGSSGTQGSGGEPGTDGQTGSQTSAGGAGRDGGSGGPGGNGANGGPGPEIMLHATMVKTRFYGRLIAVVVSGAMQDVLLVSPEQKLTIHARGGNGGNGGSGGPGGHGGNGGGGNPSGSGAKGGPGGNGGTGGNGGPGGKLQLTFDNRFPEIAQAINLDVSGGDGGAAGGPGPGGGAGHGGSGLGQNAQPGSDGNSGPGGAMGGPGQPGAQGSARAAAGDVAGQFANLKGITLL